MPYHLELGSDGHSFKGKAIVVNTQTGKHFSKSPIPMVKAEKQMRLLRGVEHGMEPKKKSSDDPCWTGYRMIGMKMKGGRSVPNCVKE